MRNGDVYKIQGYLKTGLTDDEIVEAMRRRCPEEETREWTTVLRKKSLAKKVIRKRSAKKVVPDVGSVNM